MCPTPPWLIAWREAIGPTEGWPERRETPRRRTAPLARLMRPLNGDVPAGEGTKPPRNARTGRVAAPRKDEG